MNLEVLGAFGTIVIFLAGIAVGFIIWGTEEGDYVSSTEDAEDEKD